VLLVAADSSLAGRDSAPPVRELAGVPLIGWRTDRDKDVPGAEYAFRSDDNGTVLGLVEAGLGVAIAPRLVLRPDREGIVALPFGARRPPRVLALAWHKERYRSAAAERFAELAGELAEELRSNE
jgi:DNA-binding transcriptional LysR family regulator